MQNVWNGMNIWKICAFNIHMPFTELASFETAKKEFVISF